MFDHNISTLSENPSTVHSSTLQVTTQVTIQSSSNNYQQSIEITSDNIRLDPIQSSSDFTNQITKQVSNGMTRTHIICTLRIYIWQH